MADQNNQLNNEAGSTHPSAELLFNLAKGEYEYETNRKRDLETRSGILIALISAVMGLFISTIDITLIQKGKTIIETILFILLTVSYLYPLILILISLKKFINVLITRDYTRIDVDGINYETAKLSREELYLRLARSYKNAVNDNDSINNEKVNNFKNGITNTYLAVLSFVVIYLINLVLKSLI